MLRCLKMAICFLTWLSTSMLSGAETPTVKQILDTYRDSRQRLEPLHVQLHHTEEHTDAFRSHYRMAAERQKLMLTSLRQMTPQAFKDANTQLPPGYSFDLLIREMERQYDFNHSMANIKNDSVSDVELFQKGEAYQIRTRNRVKSPDPADWKFPSESLTEQSIGTTYKEIVFFSWTPWTSPPGKIMYGSQPKYTQITSKPYHTNGARPVPAFARFVRTGSHDWHPIDAFFFQAHEHYQVTGTETVEGRDLVVVEVPVSTNSFSGYARPTGESYQLRDVYFYRAWLDLNQGALPLRIQIWRGNEESEFQVLSQFPPQHIMTTQVVREIVPGGWYPAITTLEKYDREAEKMPTAPMSQEKEAWEAYSAAVKQVPYVIHERETWKCDQVEAQIALNDEFFVLPTPPGSQIIDRDQEDKYGDIPVEELTESAKFVGKVWLLGASSLLNDWK